MFLSIVIPTLNRTKELIQALESIESELSDSVELILVDQNPKGFLEQHIPSQLLNKINLIHTNKKGGSFARNIGLFTAKGKYINFCDDDAIVEKNITMMIKNAFLKYPSAKMISFRALDTQSSALCWLPFPDQDCIVKSNNFRSLTNEFTQIWDKNYLKGLGGYDTTLGPGSYFGSEEGNDLIVRALEDGQLMYYVAETGFRHPLKNEASLKRYFHYAAGTAAFAYKHRKKAYVVKHSFMFLFKSIAGMLIYNIWKLNSTRRYWMRCYGFFCGMAKVIKKEK